MVKVNEEANSKRRKKTTSETTKPEEDIYRQVVTYEKNEALNRSADKDANLYCRTCENIREILSEIEELKNLPDGEDKTNQIAEKRIQVSLQFVLLKKLNRYEKIRTKASRDALHKEKQRVDSTQLHLHNLLYELEYLKKEISKCLQFKSKDEEIELVPEEDFYKEAPESISRPSVTKKDEHQLRLARLEWELRQRKQLSESCHKLEVGKTQAATEIVNKQERLDGLAPRLNQILEVTKPLKDYFGISSDKIQEQNNLAYLLPDPLFLLYFQVDAYQKVYDKTVSVCIKGDEDDARQLKSETPDEASDSDSDPELEESNGRNKRRHRKASRSDRHEEKRKKLLAKHPLSVEIVFQSSIKAHNSDDLIKLQITFYWLTHLHIVTTKCEIIPGVAGGVTSGDVLSKNTILTELFESDTGEDSPNIANHYQLRQVGLGTFPTLIDELGIPYNWTQKICGLDFLSAREGTLPTANKELSQSSVEVVLKVIQNRFKARLALSKQIQAFEQCNLSSLAEISHAYEYPDNVQSKLELWKRINWTDFIKIPASKPFVENQIFSSNDMIYKLIASRNSTKLIAYVSIKHNYPEQKPIFCVSVHWNEEWNTGNCEAIRDMEKVVNVEWPEKTPKKLSPKETFILGAQIHRLLACFDIFLETLPTNDFPQHKIFFKPIRGRNRSRPYKYLKVGGGIFTQ
ncbi:THO complex subunit 5 homolog isoform X2 [Chrysoperla carnea]|uniref:THO complex subunit 5 homolog isoform X2 n=1 Tax=Chrysoperla carnea TaxID=189513 RepID=UPI001D08D927|nr:THO complex subunit 5 homolog isoform X2 [Chrysoperla carnea]